MDKATKKAIHEDVRDSSIPEEMKLMYLTASACQSIVERVFQRIKNVYARHGYICDENELLSGLNEYCKTMRGKQRKYTDISFLSVGRTHHALLLIQQRLKWW